jgi:thiol-disulfide isomerase/thioredoxin
MATQRSRRGFVAPRLVLGLVVALATILLGVAGSSPTLAADEAAGEVRIVLFWGDGCPHCATEKAFLAELVERHPEVVVDDYEVWYDAANLQRFIEMAAEHGIEASGVPATFIGDRYWVGFNAAIGEQIEAVVIEEIAALATPTAAPTPAADPSPTPGVDPSPSAIELPIFGRIDPAASSLVATTALIALVDGFNPCSLWVLSVLLAMMLHSGSRRRLVAVGLTFLLVAGLAYGLFILGLFAVMDWIGYTTWLRFAIAAFVGLFGIIAIKDYFWYGRGFSLSIPEDRKPGITRRSRQIALSQRSLLALIPMTALLAGGVSLLELPCTAGFPVMWNGILAGRGVAGVEFAGLLALYLGIYLLDEIVLFGAAFATMRVTKMQERHGRALKLMAGSVMIALAVVMIAAPSLLDSVLGALAVFAGALGMAGLVMVVAPRLGLQVAEPAPAEAHVTHSRQRLLGELLEGSLLDRGLHGGLSPAPMRSAIVPPSAAAAASASSVSTSPEPSASGSPDRKARAAASSRCCSASSGESCAARSAWRRRASAPVPAGISLPMITFSLRPMRWSLAPLMAASVSTRVVSWKEAAARKLTRVERRLGDAEQNRLGRGRLAALGQDPVVRLLELEAIDELGRQQLGVAGVVDGHLAQHLPHDDLDVLVVDRHALGSVHLLDLGLTRKRWTVSTPLISR